jgi:hypothetical protein
VRDADGQQLAYIYYESEPGQRSAAKLLSKDEARRIAANIAYQICCAQRRHAPTRNWLNGKPVVFFALHNVNGAAAVWRNATKVRVMGAALPSLILN